MEKAKSVTYMCTCIDEGGRRGGCQHEDSIQNIKLKTKNKQHLSQGERQGTRRERKADKKTKTWSLALWSVKQMLIPQSHVRSGQTRDVLLGSTIYLNSVLAELLFFPFLL